MEVEGLRTNIQKLQEDITAIQKGGRRRRRRTRRREEKKKDEAANIIQKAAQERFKKLIASETCQCSDCKDTDNDS